MRKSIIDNFCMALFSGVSKLTALYNISNIFLKLSELSVVSMDVKQH